jgi:ribosomal protein S18 acetylase RimI-like enzyme
MIKQDSRETSTPRNTVNTSLKVFQILTMKTITTFYRRMVVVIQPLLDPPPELNQDLTAVIERLTEKDLPAYIQFRPDSRLNLIQARLARGDHCFATWDKGQIVNALWVATQRPYIPYLNRELLLQPGDIYIYDHRTLPAYQGCGLGQANVAFTLRHYREKKCRRAIALLAIENKAAFGPTQALGIPALGLFGCLRLGPWQWDWKEVWGDEPLPILTKTK